MYAFRPIPGAIPKGRFATRPMTKEARAEVSAVELVTAGVGRPMIETRGKDT